MLPTASKVMQGLFDNEIVPETWRGALVTLLHKGKGKPMVDSKHFLPVSITAIVCRTFERVVNCHLCNHLEESGYLSDSQHGFWSGCSCESALATVIHFISNNRVNRTRTGLVQLDLSNAFDSLNKNLLLERMTHVNIWGCWFAWMPGFLQHHSQQVVYNGARSLAMAISSGVSQGSVLGLTLLLLYVNDMPWNGRCLLVLYANDTSILASVSSLSHIHHLQHYLEEIETWMMTQHLCISSFKSSVTRFSCSKKYNCPVYIVGGTTLVAPVHLSILDVTLSRNLDFSVHIAGVVAKARRTFGLISCVTRPIGPAALQTPYTALVLPLLEYCCTVWSPPQRHLIQRLESVQHRTSCNICGWTLGRTTGPHPGQLRALGWCPLEQRQRIAGVRVPCRLLDESLSRSRLSTAVRVSKRTGQP